MTNMTQWSGASEVGSSWHHCVRSARSLAQKLGGCAGWFGIILVLSDCRLECGSGFFMAHNGLAIRREFDDP